jgi:hypothetical protein
MIVISYGFYLLVILLAIPFGAGDWFILKVSALLHLLRDFSSGFFFLCRVYSWGLLDYRL